MYSHQSINLQYYIFFFSSRRRHTIYWRDWSSDVCSSDLSEVEDVYMGCANQAGEDNRGVARMSLLLAGFPETVAGVTVNRLCGSGLEAVAQAARSVMLGEADAYVDRKSVV